ncbi:MAG: heme o synthase [Acidobacteriota bacterium]
MKPDAIPYTKSNAMTSSTSKMGDLLILAKVRVNALVVLTTAGGYYMAHPADLDPIVLGLTCLGTALVASGASGINQVYERDRDRLMDRTRQRPIADGRMSVARGTLVSVLLAVAGLGILWAFSTRAAATVALATLISYAAVYTPLKGRTSLSTVIGAVPGALPALIGWAAVRGNVSGIEPWTLFLIQFLWQLPHFLAIAWIYREDYARAGMPMLTVVDRHGVMTGAQTTLWAATLIPFSLLPYLFHMTTVAYALGALVLGIAQLILAFGFARHRSIANARTLFLASIIYLPLLWILMVVARR